MNRNALNDLDPDALRDLANHRIGGPVYTDWTMGVLLRDVMIGGEHLVSGDSVLYTPGQGSALKVWSPVLRKIHTFILPNDHVGTDARDYPDLLEPDEDWEEE